MSGGKSQSKTSSVNTTDIKTTTSTKIGDIGLTGGAATDLAAILQTGAMEMSRMSAEQQKASYGSATDMAAIIEAGGIERAKISSGADTDRLKATYGAATDMAAILESGGIERMQISSDLVETISQATGNAWNQLIGGAGYLTQIVTENENSRKEPPILPPSLMSELTFKDPKPETGDIISVDKYIPAVVLLLALAAFFFKR